MMTKMEETAGIKEEKNQHKSLYGKERDFWLEKFSKEISKSQFPYDFKQTFKTQRNKEIVPFSLEGELYYRLEKLGGGYDSRLHIILLSGVLLLLHQYGAEGEITVGVPIYKQEVEEEFINTVLPLQNRLEDGMTVKNLIMQVRENLKEAVENQNYPLQTLLYQLNLPFSAGSFPLFDVAVLLENIHKKEYLRHIDHHVTFSFLKQETAIKGEIEYTASLYRKGTIEDIVHRYIHIITTALSDLETAISRLSMMTEEEKEHLLREINTTAAGNPVEKTIHEHFAEVAGKQGDIVALVSEDQLLSYRAMHEKSSRLAAFLQHRGVTPETPVGIMADRSIEMAIAVLAILKSGGYYVPIDSDYPRERQQLVIKDCGLKFVLTGMPLEESGDSSWIYLQTPGIYNFDNEPDSEDTRSYNPLAYVMYTSGSTGQPKGAMIQHASVVRLVKNTNFINFTARDRILQTGALEFDASTFEIWGALLNGLQLYLISKNKLLSQDLLKESIRKYEITVIWLTSPLFNQLLEMEIEIFAGLGSLLVGGDVLSPPHINRLRSRYPGLKVINGYGPTENTTFSTTYLIDKDYEDNIPIGKPIANSTAYILNRFRELLPVGVPGELYVGGYGVARGYVNSPELTSERFLFSFYRSNRSYMSYQPYSRIYKTGDRARWLADKNIEFLGRIDKQIKIRGYRVEPGEIESRLTALEFISEALVIPRAMGHDEVSLCAYIVSPNQLDITEVRNRISGVLPDYMIPAYFVQVEAFPLTANKKIDMAALPEPAWEMGHNYSPPRTDIEKKLVSLWSKILKVEERIIGIDTGFFDLGGHSLRATILVNEIHRALQVKIPLAEIFNSPTIRELAEYINKSGQNRDPYASIKLVEKKEYYSLSSTQKRLYVLQGMEKAPIRYNIPTAVVLEGKIHREQIEKTFKGLIRRHESLRTAFCLVNKQPVQCIRNEVEFGIKYHDVPVTGLSIRDNAGAGNPSVPFINSFVRPFDLATAPLFRVELIKLEQETHLMAVDIHHIITDGTSMGILIKEFMALYNSEKLPEIRIQYKDFSALQQGLIESGKIKKQGQYWRKQFETGIPVLKLPTDYERPTIQSYEGCILEFQVGTRETARLKSLAATASTTLYMVMLSIYYILLAKVSGQEEIVVGTPVAGRRHADLNSVIGMFVNSLALKSSPRDEFHFDEYLKKVNTEALEAFENQEYPFEELVETVELTRDPGRSPLFDTMFSLQNMEVPVLEIPGLKLSPYKSANKIAKFDITLVGSETEDHLSFAFEYCTRLFKEDTIKRYVGYFKEIIALVSANPGIPISEIDILTPGDRQRLLEKKAETSPVEAPETNAFIEPRTELEKTLSTIWSKMLGNSPIGVTSDFFQAGGNSIKGLLTIAEINERFQTDLLIIDLFEHPTIERFAAFLKNHLDNEQVAELPGVKPAEGKITGGIAPAEKREYYVLSPAQRRMYLLHSMDKTGIVYNMPLVLEMKGELQVGQLETAIKLLMMRHDSLRTSFHLVTGEPVQRVHEQVHHGLEITGNNRKSDIKIAGGDFEPLPTSPDEAIKEFIRPFDLACVPLFRAKIIQPSQRQYILMIDMHHIISDGASMAILVREFMATYTGEELPALNLQYKDFCHWRQSKKQLDNIKQQQAYWQTQFTGQIPLLNLPLDFPRPKVQEFTGSTYHFEISTEHTLGLKELAKREEMTLYMVMLALYTILLSRISGQEDIIIGTPVVGRRQTALNPIIGMFVNTLAMRIYPSGSKTLREILREVKAMTIGAFDNQDFPFEELVETIKLSRETSRNPLFDTMFVLQNLDMPVLEIPGLQLRPYTYENRMAKFDLTLAGAEGENRLFLSFEYCTALFKEETIRRYANYFKEILAFALEKPGSMLSEIDILTETDKQLLLLTQAAAEETIAIKAGEDAYTEPHTEMEKKLAALWRKILDQEEISATADFFQLGGNSIKALLLVSEINDTFDLNLNLTHFFENPTIRQFAEFLEQYNDKPDQAEETHGITPAARISPEILDRLYRLYPGKISEVYPLTPMQEGMLFHWIVDKNSAVYFEQFSYRMQGILEIPLVQKSLEHLFQRYDILKTAFVHEGVERPLQVVLADRQVEFTHKDIRSWEPGKQKEFIQNYKKSDIQRGFDLVKDVLMRVAVIQTGEAEYEFTWSFHHILLDGWCIGILTVDFFEIYHSYLENRECHLPPAAPYRDYINWLEKQNPDASAKFWEKLLEGYNQPSLIATLKTPPPHPAQYRRESISLILDKDKTLEMNRLATRLHVTVNTILKTLWAILLARYTEKDEVVFGSVVSGRPPELKGVQSMVGLFINTIPVRIRVKHHNTAIRNRDEEPDLAQFLKNVQKEANRCEPHHYYPLAKIQAQSQLKQDLLDHILVFENFPVAEKIQGIIPANQQTQGALDRQLKITGFDGFAQSNYDFFIGVMHQETLQITFSYNGNCYAETTLRRIVKHLSILLDQVLNNDENKMKIHDLGILDRDEAGEMLGKIRREKDKAFLNEITIDNPSWGTDTAGQSAEFDF